MKWLSLGLFGLGLSILAIVSLPIAVSQISYYLDVSHYLIDPTAVLASQAHLVINVLGISTPDLTQADSWFGASSHPGAPLSSPVKYFTISLLRLGLRDVTVEVNGSDLSKNPIHFSGTSLPGAPGNPVIFGHSALPQFYRSGNPMTIFNHLPEAKIGDDILVNFDGVTYHYIIRKTQEVTPAELDVLDQPQNQHLLTLVTCVPLGTYWHRFVATAEMVD